jgi:hypothetical protein
MRMFALERSVDLRPLADVHVDDVRQLLRGQLQTFPAPSGLMPDASISRSCNLQHLLLAREHASQERTEPRPRPRSTVALHVL